MRLREAAKVTRRVPSGPFYHKHLALGILFNCPRNWELVATDERKELPSANHSQK